MNFPVQISAFLHVLMTYFNATLTNPILVLSFDSYLKFWHYHLINDGKFAVTMDLNNRTPFSPPFVNHYNSFAITDDSSKILLASLSDIKLLQCLKERNFSVVIVDEFDKVATRLLFRKLKGKFNVGLTYRNFVVSEMPSLYVNIWLGLFCTGKSWSKTSVVHVTLVKSKYCWKICGFLSVSI